MGSQPQTGPQFQVSIEVDINFANPQTAANPQCTPYQAGGYFAASAIQVVITVGGRQTTVSGFNREDLPPPIVRNRAPLIVTVKDLGCTSTLLLNWELSFAKIGGTTEPSPVSTTSASVSGANVAPANDTYTLVASSANLAIVNSGDWKWSMRLLLQDAGGNRKQFCVDPEMNVES